MEKYVILNTYNTNCALSQVLLSERNGTLVKYIYGVGLIGEERHGYFQTYHYDYRGSTVAITNECGELTFTFAYDTYGKLLNEYDYSDAIFLYNGRDGVITDRNGLVYMRARYYLPEMKRFINADIIPGEISNAITLNRYAYANGNPVSNVDPFGLEAMLDEYISANYSGVKNISLVIDTPDPSSSVVAKIENGELQNGHSFIRLDDGNGNVQYVGLYMKSEDLKKMIISGNVEGIVRFSDNKSDWDVAKTYELSDKQYSAVSKYIDNLNVDTYNLEKYNCTTFAVEILKKSGVVHWYSMPVKNIFGPCQLIYMPNWKILIN